MLQTFSGKEYELVPVSNPAIQCCYLRGFMPLGDTDYMDAHLIKDSDIGDNIAIIPEIEVKVTEVIENIIETFKDQFATAGNLPGMMLQNMATWIVAWSIEMTWCWSEDMLDRCAFSQDMTAFHVPRDKFTLVPNDWVSILVTAFMSWCYSNPGYTERHQIDIYDPLRDGYLTIARLVITRFLDSLQQTEE